MFVVLFSSFLEKDKDQGFTKKYKARFRNIGSWQFLLIHEIFVLSEKRGIYNLSSRSSANCLKFSNTADKDKLTSTDDSARVGARQRNRSLKKSPAVQDDDPTSSTASASLSNHHLLPHAQEPRRASSFDVAASSSKMTTTTLRPGSFDAGRSAFSPVEVPRLLIQSPLSPLQLEPPPATDSRLLTVPSPDFRKSPVDNNRSYACDSPGKAQDLLNPLTFGPNLLTQLSAAMSRPLGMPSPLLEEFKVTMGNVTIPKLEQMDCSGSFETVGSGGSFDLTAMSAHSSFDHGQNQISQATAELLAQMPPKSIIQDDIRNGNGRFTLVRKRGRSEVWNLFGQVLDTLTNVRLPYVACYACKVLYTDTGGGTGNMTRHRCPIGASYRSSTHGSSTETVEAGGTNSFDSTNSTNVNMLSNTNGNTSRPEIRPHLGLTINDIGGSNLVSQHSGEISIGDVDREVLTDAMVKCCALDLIDPVIFSGKGFKSLLRRICNISKRVSPSPIDSFPDVNTIRSAMQTNLRFCTDDLKNELSMTSQGVRLIIETLTYCGKDYRVIHGSRISPDWKWRSNILGVFKSRENESISEMINIVIRNYELDRNLLRVTTPSAVHDIPSSTKTFIDIIPKLKDILLAILFSCTIPVMSMLTSIEQITKSMVELDIRLPFNVETMRNDIFQTHHLLSEWNDRWQQMEHLITSKCSHLLPTFRTIGPCYMRDIETFILPFRETIESLMSEQPNFHKVLPEWQALMHECQVSDDEPSPLLRELKQKATELLKFEQDKVITDEHHIATMLNPKLNKKLDLVLTSNEQKRASERIRSICGIRNPRLPLSRGSSTDGEPFRKRKMFLSSLEDDPIGDELECYLNSQYPPQQIKDIISFWSSIGQTQFPALASLARRTLSIPATAPKTTFDPRCASVAPDQLHTFLMLRSMFDSEKDDEV
ncbi:unnamed protein product [Caenorhabditis angaria]|uniref:BED-type domain-containing protein n=1 Tax=Caenorhabditis angaria TaxID=860376 RepID=A0A9P1N2N7_9PELO|nr:unnamed protein product [Caenorhabditis angaria]